MEQSLSTLTFKGSITEAVGEAKQQKKLFLVYVSGGDQDSENQATLAWTDSMLAESILKFCILLHISEGSSDAANFFAIYPQKSPPCVTAIGYNGLLLWQCDGFIAADILVSSIEKSWLSLHIQDVTATYLATALASNQQSTSESSADVLAEHLSSPDLIFPSPNNLPEGEPSTDKEITALASKHQPTKDNSGDISAEHGSSSGSDILPSPKNLPEGEPLTYNETTALASKQQPTSESSSDILVERRSSSGSDILPEGEPSTDNETVEGNSCPQLASEVDVNETGTCLEADDVCSSGTAEVSVNPGAKEFRISEHRSLMPEGIVSHDNLVDMMGDTGKITEADVKADKNEDTRVESSNAPEPFSTESNEVHFNIRLPDGSSLRVKFTVTDSLRMVKDFVDSNRTSNFGPYDLAIPYPLKVFQAEDFGKTLQELDLFRRQTLIVIQRTIPAKKDLSLRSQPVNDCSGSSSESDDGYWARVRGIVSFLNPLSYLRGRANASDVAHESQNISMPYSSNDSVQNNLRAAGTRQSARPPFGSNIHTLKHNEEEDSDRNTFWNGNSTQFGGDSDNNK